MILDTFVRNSALVSELLRAVDILRSIDAIGVMMEIGHNRSTPPAHTNPLEVEALQGAFHRGYVECLADLVNFVERYVPKDSSILPKMDYGASRELIDRGEINENEYRSVLGRD